MNLIIGVFRENHLELLLLCHANNSEERTVGATPVATDNVSSF